MSYKYQQNTVLNNLIDFICLSCETYMTSEEEVASHITTMVHHNNLKNSVFIDIYRDDFVRKVKKGYYCQFCNILMQTMGDVGKHIAEPHHERKKNILLLKRVQNGVTAFDEILIDERAWHGIVDKTCTVCNVGFDDEILHRAESKHILNLILNKPIFGPAKSLYRKIEDCFHCLTCNDIFVPNIYKEHFNTSNHIKAYKKCRDEFNFYNLDNIVIEENEDITETKKEFSFVNFLRSLTEIKDKSNQESCNSINHFSNEESTKLTNVGSVQCQTQGTENQLKGLTVLPVTEINKKILNTPQNVTVESPSQNNDEKNFYIKNTVEIPLQENENDKYDFTNDDLIKLLVEMKQNNTNRSAHLQCDNQSSPHEAPKQKDDVIVNRSEYPNSINSPVKVIGLNQSVDTSAIQQATQKNNNINKSKYQNVIYYNDDNDNIINENYHHLNKYSVETSIKKNDENKSDKQSSSFQSSSSQENKLDEKNLISAKINPDPPAPALTAMEDMNQTKYQISGKALAKTKVSNENQSFSKAAAKPQSKEQDMIKFNLSDDKNFLLPENSKSQIYNQSSPEKEAHDVKLSTKQNYVHVPTQENKQTLYQFSCSNSASLPKNKNSKNQSSYRNFHKPQNMKKRKVNENFSQSSIKENEDNSKQFNNKEFNTILAPTKNNNTNLQHANEISSQVNKVDRNQSTSNKHSNHKSFIELLEENNSDNSLHSPTQGNDNNLNESAIRDEYNVIEAKEKILATVTIKDYNNANESVKHLPDDSAKSLELADNKPNLAAKNESIIRHENAKLIGELATFVTSVNNNEENEAILEADVEICKNLGAKYYIVSEGKKIWCILCEFSLEADEEDVHLISRHHQAIFSLHKKKTEINNAISNDLKPETVESEENKSRIIDSFSEFKKNNVHINFVYQIVYCERCMKNIPFQYQNIKNHIKEHKMGN